MQFITTHAARIYAVAVAALALVAHYVPDLPSALILALAAAVLGAGEAVHRQAAKAAAGEASADQAAPLDKHQAEDDQAAAPAGE